MPSCLVCGQWLCQDYELSMHIHGDVSGCFGCLGDPEVEPIPAEELEEKEEGPEGEEVEQSA